MRRYMIVLLLGITLLAALPAQAAPSDCQPETIAHEVSAQLANADSVEALQAAQRLLGRGIAVCNGWYFEGDTGDTPGKATFAVGPMTLPAGTYIIMYELDMMRYGELDIDFTNLNGTEEYNEVVYEFRRDVDEFTGQQAVTLQGGRYTMDIEASNILGMTVYLVQP